MLPDSVKAPLPVFTRAVVPEPSWITPLKLVDVPLAPAVNVAVEPLEPFVIVPVPAMDPKVGE